MDAEKMDLDSYRNRVRLVADLRNGEEALFNGSPEHAAIIVERLFAVANKHVALLTGDLDAKVFGDAAVVQSARQFLAQSDHTLDVIVEKDTFSASHPLIEAVGRDANVRIYKLRADQTVPFHFMTADNDCFRFEREKDTHTAVAAFGDEVSTGNLNQIFAQLLDRSDEITRH